MLKTQGEPIQQNVGERFAFYSKKKSTERKELVKLFRKIYDIRSKFIHHGKEIENMDTISLFMENVFKFFFHLMLDLENFKTKEDFIKHIDEIKFS
ncbi:MAG: hypothetical protein WBG30_05195 [Psychrilyobacter sp.]|uniref:hypothetical protein n=1 Tax=Psychrilyobacter sp. TaxID=2586924 RepID=UPI003C741E33